MNAATAVAIGSGDAVNFFQSEAVPLLTAVQSAPSNWGRSSSNSACDIGAACGGRSIVMARSSRRSRVSVVKIMGRSRWKWNGSGSEALSRTAKTIPVERRITLRRVAEGSRSTLSSATIQLCEARDWRSRALEGRGHKGAGPGSMRARSMPAMADLADEDAPCRTRIG